MYNADLQYDRMSYIGEIRSLPDKALAAAGQNNTLMIESGK